jgi:hypothetical protein
MQDGLTVEIVEEGAVARRRRAGGRVRRDRDGIARSTIRVSGRDWQASSRFTAPASFDWKVDTTTLGRRDPVAWPARWKTTRGRSACTILPRRSACATSQAELECAPGGRPPLRESA